MTKSAENELKTPKKTLEKRLERRPNGARAASQLFIMICFVSSDGIMADVYCVMSMLGLSASMAGRKCIIIDT